MFSFRRWMIKNVYAKYFKIIPGKISKKNGSLSKLFYIKIQQLSN